MSLSPEAIQVARDAYEQSVVEGHRSMIAMVRKAGTKLPKFLRQADEFERLGPRLARREDGEYEDSNRRVAWHNWLRAFRHGVEFGKAN